MTQYAVHAGTLTPTIYVGRPNRSGQAFADKIEMTDEVLLAVAQYVKDHFGGGLKADYTNKDDGSRIVVEVTVTEERP